MSEPDDVMEYRSPREFLAVAGRLNLSDQVEVYTPDSRPLIRRLKEKFFKKPRRAFLWESLNEFYGETLDDDGLCKELVAIPFSGPIVLFFEGDPIVLRVSSLSVIARIVPDCLNFEDAYMTNENIEFVAVYSHHELFYYLGDDMPIG